MDGYRFDFGVYCLLGFKMCDMKTDKIKCYELDFGDTNLISEKISDILGWIETDMGDMESFDELNYKITVKYLTQEEFESLPEWGS